MFGNLFAPLLTRTSFMNSVFTPTTFTRGIAKTNRSAYKRWRKTAGGYKRGLSGRKHGNASWTSSVLRKHTGTAMATSSGHGNMKKRLGKMLPYL
ncbi:unnamed protein product [Kuraishia capsulata CBS 1993]|uniref:50S ribosomal protein L35 n=1 Tax=Kuraishia capsulata CBS 1993 TaxID=1382522 RepID=W6MTD3_9ASCO|nr:uncharacterized protein KUCA_T00005676001 [Kuraishia capsulata CBS 1993]CDK29683.1 unnamed protein product [Kuraishia capsulata CBS 1993]